MGVVWGGLGGIGVDWGWIGVVYGGLGWIGVDWGVLGWTGFDLGELSTYINTYIHIYAPQRRAAHSGGNKVHTGESWARPCDRRCIALCAETGLAIPSVTGHKGSAAAATGGIAPQRRTPGGAHAGEWQRQGLRAG